MSPGQVLKRGSLLTLHLGNASAYVKKVVFCGCTKTDKLPPVTSRELTLVGTEYYKTECEKSLGVRNDLSRLQCPIPQASSHLEAGGLGLNHLLLDYRNALQLATTISYPKSLQCNTPVALWEL